MKGSLESFSRDPVSFMLPSFIYPLFMLVTIGASVGVLLLLFLVLTALGVASDATLIVLGVAAAVLLLVNSVFSAGYKGALFDEYYRALRAEPVGFVTFMNFAFKHAVPLFVISLVKIIIAGFLLTPLALVYYFLDVASMHEAATYGLAAVALFLLFVIEFFFAFSFIAYVEKKVRPFSAILISLNFVKDVNVKALLVYVLYCVVVLSTFVPLLNIVMYFVFYPIAASSLIKFFEKETSHY
jgi:hypothetical protein